MAFTQETFAPVGPQSTAAPSVYTYSTPDSSTDVTGAGYFATKQNQLSEGDYIFAVTSSGTFTFVVSDATDTVTASGETLIGRSIVREAADLAGTLSSTVEYFLDGVIDMGSQSIEIPAGGLHLSGYGFDTSKLISSANTYTMFTSPIGGSGGLIGSGYAIEVTGTGSQVYDVVDATGFNAIEVSRVNYNDCTSLGTIDGYRQGLETGTGRFGGTPNLTLEGAWVGGFRITTSIVRSLDAGMTGALFQKGGAFTMASRFLTDMNVDLPANTAILDFNSANFTAPSLLQLNGMIVTRNGVSDAGDANLTPNISQADIASQWTGNQGLNNTFEGGKLEITAETATVISVQNTFYPILGTWDASELQHFDEAANGQLRHIGNNPREYSLVGDLVVDGTANDVLRINVVTNDGGGDTVVGSQVRQVNSLVGARDVAFFTLASNFILDQNDYVYLSITNETAGRNATAEISSFFQLVRR